jgi:hypothetical protein
MLLFFLLVKLLTLPIQEFEGIIVYKTVYNNGKKEFETVYFSPDKLRFETESYFNSELKTYSSIFDFGGAEYISYHYENNVQMDVLLYDTLPYSLSIKKFYEDSIISILGFECSYLLVEHDDTVIFDDFEAQFLYSRNLFLANGLRFTVPLELGMEHHMVLSFDDRVALRMDFESSTPLYGTLTTYTREAVAIIPMKLPPQVFEIK